MKNIVLVGGGFGGINFAKNISSKINCEVTLIDKNNYHFFPPLRYQVGTAFIESSNISYPFRKMFHKKSIRFYMGNLQQVIP